MNRCENCLYWEKISLYPSVGLCAGLSLKQFCGLFQIEELVLGIEPSIRTFSMFGCNSFKEKQAAPFIVATLSDYYVAVHKDDKTQTAYMFPKTEEGAHRAKEQARILNELWESNPYSRQLDE